MFVKGSSMKPTVHRFLKLLCGEYSNQKQALDNPPFYAHIFLRYRPIEHLQTGSILLEQTYALDPKHPYRLRMIRAEELQPGVIKLWNYSFRKPEQFYTATFDAERRLMIREDHLICMDDCHYQVKEQANGFQGEIEPGSRCMVQRDGKQTYLVSSFHLQGDKLSTLDRGHDPVTHERCWGSIAGEFRFRRTADWSSELPARWA